MSAIAAHYFRHSTAAMGGGKSTSEPSPIEEKPKKKAAKKQPAKPKTAPSTTTPSSRKGFPTPLPCPIGSPRPRTGTDKLYMDNTTCFRCEEASVVSARASEDGAQTIVVLDKTIFHPQGGGQPSDIGIVRSADSMVVFRVAMVKEDRATGIIEHAGTFEAGDLGALKQQRAGLVLEIEGPWRVSCARIHSAGHALDVAMLALGHTIRPTKGYHFPDGPYVEYEARSAEERLSTEAKDALPVSSSASPFVITVHFLVYLRGWFPVRHPCDLARLIAPLTD